MKFAALPVVAVVLAGALAAAPAAAAAPRPSGLAVITGHGHGVHPGRADDPAPPRPTWVSGPDDYTSTLVNWAGWADVGDTNVQLRYVTANFVVPTVTCPGAYYGASFWVGLDGDQEGSTVEQAGVEAFCNIQLPSGGWVPSYNSFWEMYHPGDNGPHLGGSVSPGDQIATSVYYDSSTGQYNLALNDGNRNGANIQTSQPCPSGWTCHNKTAEVIAEDPGGGPPNSNYLAHFSQVSFTQIGVTSRNGTKGTLEGNNLWASNEILMAYNGHAMATPSARESGYTAFSVTWNGSG